MEKEVLIAIIGAISVMGAALFQSGLIPDLISNGDKEAGIAVIEKSIEPPKLTSFGPERDSPQKVGTTIRWTARAQDPDDETLYYKFLLMGPSTGGSWDAVQDWRTQSWWDWDPSEAGSYQVQVEVRDGDHSGPQGRDDSRSARYEIEELDGSDGAEISEEPPVLRSLKPDKTSPQVVGTTIKWTATAEDPDDETLYYRFLLMGPSNGGSWDGVQDWSTQSWWDWSPSEAGSYQVQVEVRDGDHSGPQGRDDSRSARYEIEEKEAEKVVPAFFSEEDPAVAASSWSEGRLDLFVRGTDGALYHRSGDGSTWSEWERLGGELTSAPAAVSWDPGRIDVFALRNDNAVWHIWGDGATWSDWESLGGNWTSAPAVSSPGENVLDVFIRGEDNALYINRWDGRQSKWGGWQTLGGHLTSAPAAVYSGSSRTDIFAKGPGNTLVHKWWDVPKWAWSEWESLGGVLTSAPTVSSPDEYTLDVYIRGEDNALYMNRWDGRQSKWGGWQTLGGKLTSAPAAVYSGSSRTDVFAKGPGNTLVHKWWGAPKWDWNDFEEIGEWP